MSKVLVAGSYPPVPGRAASVTLGAVRRCVDRSDEVTVVSPRPSAAHRHAPMTGLGAALTLWLLRRSSHADTLVLCLERGVPLGRAKSELWRSVETKLLSASMARFGRVSLLLGSDVEYLSEALRSLWRPGYEVVVANDHERDLVNTALGVERAPVVVEPVTQRSRGELAVGSTGDGASSERGPVTALGPREFDKGEWARSVAARAERAVYHAEHSAARAAHVVMGDRAHLLGRPVRFVVEPIRTRIRRRAQRRAA
jgi:hypothetical protein